MRECKHLFPGMSDELYYRLYFTVQRAIRRCTDVEHTSYAMYRRHGVMVYAAWLADPSLFMQHLATLPGHDDFLLVLDRADNSKGYEPGNLRFVTRSVSTLNSRRCGNGEYSKARAVRVAHKLTLYQIAKVLGCRAWQLSSFERGGSYPKSELRRRVVVFYEELERRLL
jgi:hypothetical protein